MSSLESLSDNKNQLTEHIDLSDANQLNVLNQSYVFQEFVEGPTNKVAFETCKAIVDQLGASKHNPLFLYGASGLGKTHLIQAVGHAVLDSLHNATIIYLNAAQVFAEFSQARQPQRIGQFRKVDLLLIDDFELLAGKSAALDDFFKVIDDLSKESKQIIIASNLYPQEIIELDARLLSQLPRALFIEVEPPELENRVDFLLRYSKLYQYELKNDCAVFIAQQVLGNVRELVNALNKVSAVATFQGVEINRKLIKETLKDQFTSRAKLK